jgi:hypothetical protein
MNTIAAKDRVSLRTRRFGGALGIIAALAMIPAYVVGSPEVPASTDEAADYYEQAALFVSANGWLPILHLIGLMLFLGVLAAVLRSAAPAAHAWRTAAIGGGFVWVALTAAGFAAEVAYPAASLRFEDVTATGVLAPLMLTLASWLYHFCQVGAAVLMIGTAVASYTAGPDGQRAFPRWFAYASIPFIVLALLHTWLPYSYWSAIAGLGWLVIASLLLFAAPKPAVRTVE